MGFRDLAKFNEALLAKQAWKILQNPQSLLARIYKGRYYHTLDFLQSRCGTNPSYGWRSIQAGKDLLIKGLRVQVGDGLSTKIMEDCWISTIPPRKLTGTLSDQDQLVKDLWLPGTRDWNRDLISNIFSEVDAQAIFNTVTSRHAVGDRWIWPYNKNGQYSVKSGYRVAINVLEEEDQVLPPTGDVEIKKQIWKLNIAPKIKTFFWRVLSGAIATSERLQTRIPGVDPICQKCCLENESINHILFDCQYAQAVWRCAGVILFEEGSVTLEHNISLLLENYNNYRLSNKERLLPLWLCWILWKSRNEFLFNKRNVHPMKDAERGQDAVLEWTQCVMQEESSSMAVPNLVIKSSAWEPPPPGWIKCNFDSSFHMDRDDIGIGWIVRDEVGKHLVSGHTKLRAGTSSLQAEALGFLHVLQLMWVKGFRYVWFEGDNLELVNVINKQQECVEIGNILIDIRYWIMLLPNCSLGHINREKNQAADHLAKLAISSNISSVIYDVPVVSVLKFLYEPFTI